MKKPKYEVSILPQIDKAGGLDLHKDNIVLFVSDKSGEHQHLGEFGTFTKDLHQVKACLIEHGVKHCLMESTGVYWVSLYGILTEAGIGVTVANPLHVRQIPRRKTDRQDARWLCTLLLNGLVRKSFIPTAVQSELRDYCRMRLGYTQQRSRVFNRVIKILEINNIKLRSVLSNIHTKTGLDIIRLLARGETDEQKLLSCIRRGVKKDKEQFSLALQGTLKKHHRQMLQLLLQDIDFFQKRIETLDKTIAKLVTAHYAQASECLDSISGIAPQTAETILSEIGDDMSRFPTADHLTAWCGVAPGNNESAKKRKNTRVKKRQQIFTPCHHRSSLGCRAQKGLLLERAVFLSAQTHAGTESHRSHCPQAVEGRLQDHS